MYRRFSLYCLEHFVMSMCQLKWDMWYISVWLISYSATCTTEYQVQYWVDTSHCHHFLIIHYSVSFYAIQTFDFFTVLFSWHQTKLCAKCFALKVSFNLQLVYCISQSSCDVMGRGDTLLVTASSASQVKYNLVMLSNHLSIIICLFNFEDPSAFLKLSNGKFPYSRYVKCFRIILYQWFCLTQT